MRLFFQSAEARQELADMNRGVSVGAEDRPGKDGLVAIRGRVQNGVVVLDPAAAMPDGTQVAVMVRAAPAPPNQTMPEAERQRVLEIMDRIAALPDENPGDRFSGADRDRVL